MKKQKLLPYVYILPSLIVLGLVFVYPIFKLINDSFYRIAGGERVFIRFDNYIYLFTDYPVIKIAILNNLKLLLIIPILLTISVIFAVLFYEGIKGGKVYRTIIFIPKVISIVVIGVVFSYLLRSNGIINHVLKSINLDFLALNWYGNKTIAIYTIIAIFIWKELGFGILLFSARLTSLDESIIDASKVDGANWFQKLIYVIIPQLKGLIYFFIIYHIMVVFAWMFPYIFIITGGGPANTTTILELEIYRFAFQRALPALASTLAVLLLFGTMIFIFLQHRIRKMTD